ncbi:MAG TPA: hypothetical protein VF841_15830 [Anaeromyxobacter sp.]
MNPRAIFGIGALASLASSVTFAGLYLWPRLRTMDRERGLASLVAPHMFLRFLGLSFLVPGVVSPSLPRAFAASAAYGDVIAGLLAIVATLALRRYASRAAPLVWIFNVWGAADLLFAGIQGMRTGLDPGALGAAYFLPTFVVPPMLVAHGLTFLLLVRRPEAMRGRQSDVDPRASAARPVSSRTASAAP